MAEIQSPDPTGLNYMHAIRYAFSTKGNANFFRAVADATEIVLDNSLSEPDWLYDQGYFKDIPILRQKQRVLAHCDFEILGMVAMFMAGYFSEKILDEIYDRLMKRPIAEFIDALLKNIKIQDGKIIEYRDVIHFENLGLTIVIRVYVGPDNNLNIQDLLLHAHRTAYEDIKTNGVRAPIHCFEIKNGLLTLEPSLFNGLEEINQNDLQNTKLYSVTTRKLLNS